LRQIREARPLPGRWLGTLLGFVLALPVPVLAASGFAFPLPDVVVKLAVGLAERTSAVALSVGGLSLTDEADAAEPLRGEILLTSTERAALLTSIAPARIKSSGAARGLAVGKAKRRKPKQPEGKASRPMLVGSDAPAPTSSRPTVRAGTLSTPPEAASNVSRKPDDLSAIPSAAAPTGAAPAPAHDSPKPKPKPKPKPAPETPASTPKPPVAPASPSASSPSAEPTPPSPPAPTESAAPPALPSSPLSPAPAPAPPPPAPAPAPPVAPSDGDAGGDATNGQGNGQGQSNGQGQGHGYGHDKHG
jgi:hypothetical protein